MPVQYQLVEWYILYGTGRNISLYHTSCLQATSTLPRCAPAFTRRFSRVSLARVFPQKKVKGHFESSQWLTQSPSARDFLRNLTAFHPRRTCFDQAKPKPDFDTTFLLLHISPTREWLFSHLQLTVNINIIITTRANLPFATTYYNSKPACFHLNKKKERRLQRYQLSTLKRVIRSE